LGRFAENGLQYGRQLQNSLEGHALEALNGLASRYDSARQQVQHIASTAARDLSVYGSTTLNAGQAALANLRWMASHPGEAASAAQHQLVQAALNVQGHAHEAYQVLESMGERGLGAVRQVVDQAIQAGENGIDALSWVAHHPSQAAREVASRAVDGLASIARAGGSAARAAIDRLNTMVQETTEAGRNAGRALRQLVNEGGEAGRAVIVAWDQAWRNNRAQLQRSASNLAFAAGDSAEQWLRQRRSQGGIVGNAIQTYLSWWGL